MTTYLGKSCSFGFPRVPFVNCRQFMYLVISLLVLRAGCGIWLYQFLIIAYLFTLTQWELLNIQDDLLVRRWNILGTDKVIWQAVVPLCLRKKVLRRKVLKYSHDIKASSHIGIKKTLCKIRQGYYWPGPGAVARSKASSLGMQAAQSSIPTSGTFFRGDLVMKTFLRPFSLFRWFKSSCQLLAKECALSTGKLPGRLAQEQCG